jgi:chromosome segregation ATPase
MKLILPIALGIICLGLIGVLVKTKNDDNVRHEAEVQVMTDLSNRLDTARAQLTSRQGTIDALSNRLDACQSEVAALSNQVSAAKSEVIARSGEVTSLSKQIDALTAQNQSLGRDISELTNQVIAVAKALAVTEVSLRQANKNYALLENRLRRDIGARVIIERKFNSPWELQSQLAKLKENPAGIISAESILADLEIEVSSNGTYHVLSAD